MCVSVYVCEYVCMCVCVCVCAHGMTMCVCDEQHVDIYELRMI